MMDGEMAATKAEKKRTFDYQAGRASAFEEMRIVLMETASGYWEKDKTDIADAIKRTSRMAQQFSEEASRKQRESGYINV